MSSSPKTPKRVYLETFGCQMNKLDSELVEGQLKNSGYNFVAEAEEANIVLFNTCSVRKLSEDKILSRLGKIKERKLKGEEVIVGVLGCMAERAHDELAKSRSFIDFLVGPSQIHNTNKLITNIISKKSPQKKTLTSLSYFRDRKGKAENESLSPLDNLEQLDALRPTHARSQAWQAYVRITRGCNKFCAFCVVPRTRGPEVHRSPQVIIEEIKKLVDSGALEITLVGQTINHYYYQDNFKTTSFADLLFEIHEHIPNLKRLRFLTSYPRDFDNNTLDVMASCARICNYLHIPAQSGSDKILKLMNRGYDRELYLGLIERARSRMPDISLVGDMIVGYPGETDTDFEESLDLIKKVNYKNIYVFKYSPRPNTVAHKRFPDTVTTETKKLRNNIMLKLQKDIAHKHHQTLINKDLEILCEGKAKIDNQNLVSLGTKNSNNFNLVGRTSGDHIVHFSGPENLIGKLINIKITTARPLSLTGNII